MEYAGLIIFVLVILVFLLLFAFMAFLFVGTPFLMKRRIASWTEGKAASQAYESLGTGASRSFFQMRPASFMKEGQMTIQQPPEVALGMIANFFHSGFGKKILSYDPSGIVVSRRLLPFLAMDIGWIGVFLAHPSPQGTTVTYRMRSTNMMPVFTIFLRLYLEMGLLGPLKRSVYAF